MRGRRGLPLTRMIGALALVAGVACGSSGKKSTPDGGHKDGGGAAGAAGMSPDAAADHRDAPTGVDAPGDPSSDGFFGVGGASGAGGAVAANDSVLTHHHDNSRAGVYVQPKLTKAAAATLVVDQTFAATLPDPKDQVYAQPLFVDGGATGTDLVIVATEANNVYALKAATGGVAWMTKLGTPVPLAMMSCGNLDPFGVTGTPVIDLGSRTLYVVAAVVPMTGGPTYEIFALSLDTGLPRTGWPIDVTTVAKSGTTSFSAMTQGQRGALALVGGTLYVPFGGLYGTCLPFHGWLLAVSTADPTQVAVWATTAVGGGLWSPGGVASDGASVFVQTGTTFSTATWAGGDAILRFAAGALTPADSFAPTNWHDLDEGDLGGGASPVLFTLAGATPTALAISLFKDGNAYLLDPAHLGSVGAALRAASAPSTDPSASAHVATGTVISAPVVYTTATATYVAFKGPGAACAGGGSHALTTYKIVPGAPPSFMPAWCAGAGTGSPMVTTSNGKDDTIVWLPGAETSGGGVLQAFDGDTGVAITFPGGTTVIPNMARYNAPIAAKGRIFVAGTGTVVAFTTPP